MKDTNPQSADVEAIERDRDPEPTAEQLSAALAQTPRGAFALAGLTTGALLLAWLLLYFFVFIPRGSVG